MGAKSGNFHAYRNLCYNGKQNERGHGYEYQTDDPGAA